MKLAKITFLAVGAIFWAVNISPVFAVQNSGVGGKPANPRADNPRSESIFVHEIEPGQSVADAIEIINNTSEPVTAEVYPVDAQVSSGGAFACEQKADELDREGSWIKLDKSQVELGPNSREVINFKISVPKNTSVGEHNACIAIQAIAAPQPSGVNGVELSFRSAVRVTITVPGELNKQLSFESLSLIQKKDKMVANQVLSNSGNVSLDSNLKTNLKTIFGLSLEQVEGEYPVLAGQNAEFNVELKRPLLGGFYFLDASATYNSDEDASLGEEGSTTETVSKSKVVFIVPHPLVAFALLLTIFAVIVPFVLRRRKKNELEKLRTQAISHKVKKNEDIVAVSAKYGADWQQTARLNSLKAPYILTQDEEILVVPSPKFVDKKVATKKEAVKKVETKNSKKIANSSGVIKPKKPVKKVAKKTAKKKE